MKRPRLAFALLFSFIIPTLAAAADVPAASVPDAVKSITAREIGGHLRFLASDFMKGRDTTSPELRLAGEYLAAHLVGAGAEPLGDQARGTARIFSSSSPSRSSHPGGRNRAILDPRAQRLQARRALQARDRLRGLSRGIVPGEIEAPVVFAGYGRVDPERKIDDYAGLDVKNRFVLVYSGQPGRTPRTGRGAAAGECERMSGALVKRETAQKKGALGVLEIQPPGHETPVPDVPFSGRNLGFSGTRA